MLTQSQLDAINAARRQKGKKILSLAEARALSARRDETHRRDSPDSGLSMSDYLIGHVTGIPYNLSSGLGAMSRSHDTPSRSVSDDTPSRSSGYEGHHSSPQSDSGGGFSGGDSGGGGGGGGGGE